MRHSSASLRLDDFREPIFIHMAITNKQLAMIHATKHYIRLEELEYRGMLYDVAGVTSAKQLDQKGFERVMAWFERKGGRSGQLFQRVSSSVYCSARQIREMEMLAHDRTTLLDSLVARMSGGAAANHTKLRAWQAGKVIEALKAIVRREIDQMAASHPSGLAMLVRTWSHGETRLLKDLSSRDLVHLWKMLMGEPLCAHSCRQRPNNEAEAVSADSSARLAAAEPPFPAPPPPPPDGQSEPQKTADELAAGFLDIPF